MNTISRAPIRIGLLLATLAAFVAFAARAASAQAPTTQRLTLGDAVRLAARQSATSEGARLRAAEAEARVRQSRSALLPQLSATASQGARTFNTASFGISFPSAPGQKPLFDPNGQVEGPVNATDARAHASMSFLDLSSLARVRAAQSAARSAGAEASNVSEQAGSAAAQAYLRTLRSDAQLRARVADSTLASDLLGIARDQLTAGVGVALDVTRAQSQLAGVRAQLIAARNESARSRLDLLRVLGLPLDTPLELADSLGNVRGDVPAGGEQEAIDRAMRTRPDVRAVEQQLIAAQRQVAATRAERLPTVGFFGDDGWNGKSAQYLLPTYNWGVQLSLPLFDGFRREARVQEQQLQTREVEVRRHDVQQQVAVEVRGALLDLRSAAEQVEAARERLRLAEQEVSQAGERFRAGVAGNADVITAALTLNAARTQLVDALTAYDAARVGLARAQGTVTELQ